MWPNPYFLPKKLSAFHVNQPLSLASFAPESEQGELVSSNACVCPVRALKQYIVVSGTFCNRDAWFVCYGRHIKGHALSKLRLSH